MRLYIPRLGDKLTLTEDWYFKLYPDSRNEKLGAYFDKYYLGLNTNGLCVWVDKEIHELNPGYNPPCLVYLTNESKYQMTETQKEYDEWRVKFDAYQKAAAEKYTKTIDIYITEGSILTVDRIYIRKGAYDYDSVSFWVEGLAPKKIRFWAKLDDCNNIEFK